MEPMMKGSIAPLAWEWRCAIDPFQVVYRLCWSWKDIFVTHLTTSCWIPNAHEFIWGLVMLEESLRLMALWWWCPEIDTLFSSSWPLIWTSTEALFHLLMNGETKRNANFTTFWPRSEKIRFESATKSLNDRLFWMVTSRHGFLLVSGF